MSNHPFDDNSSYPQDLPLLEELGLPSWHCELHKEFFVGEVRPFVKEENPSFQTVIRIYVTCHPAQDYRFEIIRPIDNLNITGLEQLEVRTTAGSLSASWPTVMLIADNCLTITSPIRLM